MKKTIIKLSTLTAAIIGLSAQGVIFARAEADTGDKALSSLSSKAITPQELQQAALAAATAEALNKQYTVKNLGAFPQNGKKRPDGASTLSQDAFKKARYDPSENIREVLGGRDDYEYRLHSNSLNSNSFFLELRPANAPDDVHSVWLSITPKPGVDPNARVEMTPEQQSAMTAKLSKIST